MFRSNYGSRQDLTKCFLQRNLTVENLFVLLPIIAQKLTFTSGSDNDWTDSRGDCKSFDSFKFQRCITYNLITLYNIMLGPERELCYVLHGSVVVDDETVVLPVAPGPGLSLRDHQHRLHRENHPRLEDRVHILTQLESRLSETRRN